MSDILRLTIPIAQSNISVTLYSDAKQIFQVCVIFVLPSSTDIPGTLVCT